MIEAKTIAALIRRIGRTQQPEILGTFSFRYDACGSRRDSSAVCRYVGQEPGTDFATGQVVWNHLEGCCKFTKTRVDMAALNIAEIMNKKSEKEPWAA